MITITDEVFEQFVREAIDAIPEKYATRIKNLAFVVEDEPNEIQRQKLNLHSGESLYGLYEGIPLTQRGISYNLVLPDKITIFKHPLQYSSKDLEDLKTQIRHTVWHEVAHYYGLDHDRIHELEGKP
jgi:predicted Zn-dependent protease with MMP-like domain